MPARCHHGDHVTVTAGFMMRYICGGVHLEHTVGELLLMLVRLLQMLQMMILLLVLRQFALDLDRIHLHHHAIVRVDGDLLSGAVVQCFRHMHIQHVRLVLLLLEMVLMMMLMVLVQLLLVMFTRIGRDHDRLERFIRTTINTVLRHVRLERLRLLIRQRGMMLPLFAMRRMRALCSSSSIRTRRRCLVHWVQRLKLHCPRCFGGRFVLIQRVHRVALFVHHVVVVVVIHIAQIIVRLRPNTTAAIRADLAAIRIASVIGGLLVHHGRGRRCGRLSGKVQKSH